MGSIGARQQRFEVLPTPEWHAEDVLAPVETTTREVSSVSRPGTSASEAAAPDRG